MEMDRLNSFVCEMDREALELRKGQRGSIMAEINSFELDLISTFALIESLMGIQIKSAEIEKNGAKIKYKKNYRVKMTLEEINKERTK